MLVFRLTPVPWSLGLIVKWYVKKPWLLRLCMSWYHVLFPRWLSRGLRFLGRRRGLGIAFSNYLIEFLYVTRNLCL